MKKEINILRGCTAHTNENEKECNPNSCNKLNVHNYLSDIPTNENTPEIVEVRFKNTRKGFFLNVNKLKLTEGEMVAVEASPGHDIGVVSLTGELVREQMKRKRIRNTDRLRKIYRKVKDLDIEKWDKAIAREHKVMLRSRQIAADLGLDMKIGDVEFQGDGSKAIFYYIADGRVDFRQLIKVLADEFRIRIEMKQIGARQEAGRIGGIGSCGRELCCASWMTNFVTVSTDTAREQELSLNPQKLAGQCSKLKCCLNFEQETYTDAKKDFPGKLPLDTEEGKAFYMKTDVHKRIMWYSFDAHMPKNVTAVSVDRVKTVIEMNRNGKKPAKLLTISEYENIKIEKATDLASQTSLTRFDKPKRKSKKRRSKKRKPNNKKHSAQKKPSGKNTGSSKSGGKKYYKKKKRYTPKNKKNKPGNDQSKK